MTASGICVFETAIGHCGLAWAERGIVGVQLPESDREATRSRCLERFPDFSETRVPAEIRAVRDGIIALLKGRPQDLTDVVLDMHAVTPFRRKVYVAARAIARGETLTYGELAALLGTPGSARAVGQALGCNPFPIIVPCHRVLAAGGKAGGFTAQGGVSTKLRMLALEGISMAPVEQPEVARDLTAAVRHLRAADRILGRTIDAVGPCLIEQQPAGSTFAALAEAIVYQQLNGRAAATIFGRVCALMPRSRGGPRAADLLKLSDASLRAAGLSQNKLLSLRDLAQRSVAGEIPTIDALNAMDDEAIIERLITVRGIGRWTVEMLLMFRLGRLDVLPVDDFGVRQGYVAAFRKREQPTRQELARHGERWRPYRSIASWYLWRAAETRG